MNESESECMNVFTAVNQGACDSPWSGHGIREASARLLAFHICVTQSKHTSQQQSHAGCHESPHATGTADLIVSIRSVWGKTVASLFFQ